ncbi:hypothetical protein GCM10028806_20430 [Spirosoma terrae]|uniref:DUF5672 domain-containing protein n=1 Tax=Spirosoma terrae TaxID=1968276 RepID=A0A6L9L7C5_9BACT|nr:DUF5672 family protein [Spirosoma terrae]NDU94643.1 hypothetical protein [Spirosoma terrae]
MKDSTPISVGVVIPVYKRTITNHESIALQQCMQVLGHYPVWLAAPHRLDLSYYLNLYPNLQVRTFDDQFFTGIAAYNKLMLSNVFYEAFQDIEYMLIHQLDAFVFKDELADWCRKGYDYIGAPWLRDRDYTSWHDELWFRIKQKIATLAGLKKPDGITPREIISLNSVGNGGLSLRRVPAMLRSLKKYNYIIKRYEQYDLHQYNEDVFWGIEVNRFWPSLRIPDFRTALRFAIEFYPQRAIENYNGGQLPFGCHAWDIHGTDYWRPIFAQYGYQI